jgi:prepilin-type N-terminal cleavage/methylation domain-containing protein
MLFSESFKYQHIKNRGLTLVELLVVIAIISMLMAILFPVTIKVWQFALQVKCASNLNHIGNGLVDYEQDHDGYGPFIGEDPIDTSTGFIRQTPEEILSGSLSENWSVWNCPADRDKPRKVWFATEWLTPPPHLEEKMRNISYVWSEIVLRGPHPFLPGAPGPPWQPILYDRFKGAILADGKRMLNVWDWREALRFDYELNSLDQSHSSGKYYKVNLLFSDTHVKDITCDEKTLKSILPW